MLEDAGDVIDHDEIEKPEDERQTDVPDELVDEGPEPPAESDG